MAFTVGDFQDLVRLLDQYPEWRAELRRLVLTDELVGLLTAMRELAEAIGRLDNRVDGLDERVARLETAIAALTKAQADVRLDRAESNIGSLRG